MGRNLGEIGVAKPERDDTFSYFGSECRVHPDLTDLLLVDFLVQADQIDRSDVSRSLRAVTDFLRRLVHPDDWETFWSAALANRQGVEDLMLTMQRLVEGVSGRPTGRRSGSSPGRRSTAVSSKGPSSSKVVRRLARQGRADLALVASRAIEARQAG